MLTAISPTKRPFSYHLLRLKQRDNLTYERMSETCGGKPSVPWFSQLLDHSDSWVADRGRSKRNAPGPDLWPGFARLLGVDEETVRWWIAQEWFRLSEGLMPAPVRAMAPEIMMLDEGDRRLATEFMKRLNRERRKAREKREHEEKEGLSASNARLDAMFRETPPAA